MGDSACHWVCVVSLQYSQLETEAPQSGHLESMWPSPGFLCSEMKQTTSCYNTSVQHNLHIQMKPTVTAATKETSSSSAPRIRRGWRPGQKEEKDGGMNGCYSQPLHSLLWYEAPVLVQTLLKPPSLLVWVAGEEVLLSSDGDFVTPGPGCKQLRRTGIQRKTITLSSSHLITDALINR